MRARLTIIDIELAAALGDDILRACFLLRRSFLTPAQGCIALRKVVRLNFLASRRDIPMVARQFIAGISSVRIFSPVGTTEIRRTDSAVPTGLSILLP